MLSGWNLSPDAELSKKNRTIGGRGQPFRAFLAGKILPTVFVFSSPKRLSVLSLHYCASVVLFSIVLVARS